MKALLGLKEAELQELALKLGIEPYRGSQLASWIYQKGETNFALMTDLSQAERERLARETRINPLQIQGIRTARDRTTKYLFELEDGEMIETVRILHRKWETICVSTQVGCPIGCAFCASGRDFVRNLTAGEIVGQVLLARKDESPNIVFMGIGEPLLNREELFRALEVLNAEVGIGARNITVSTVGIVTGIRELTELGRGENLAISLHAPNDELRHRLIPAQLPPLGEVLKAARYFFEKTGRRISFEYVLLSGVNDCPEHAKNLAELLRSCDFKFHLNLIPYNSTGSNFKSPPPGEVRNLKHFLEERGLRVTIRKERANQIEAACGQLRHQQRRIRDDTSM